MPRGSALVHCASVLGGCAACSQQFQAGQPVLVVDGRAYHAEPINGKQCYVDHEAQAALVIDTGYGSLCGGDDRDALLAAMQTPAGAALLAMFGYHQKVVVVYGFRAQEGGGWPFLAMDGHYEGKGGVYAAFDDPAVPLYISKEAWGTWMAVIQVSGKALPPFPEGDGWSVHSFTGAPDEAELEHLVVVLCQNPAGAMPRKGETGLEVDREGHAVVSKAFPGCEVLYATSAVHYQPPGAEDGWVGVGVAAASESTGQVFSLSLNCTELYAFKPSPGEVYPLVFIENPRACEGMATEPVKRYNRTA